MLYVSIHIKEFFIINILFSLNKNHATFFLTPMQKYPKIIHYKQQKKTTNNLKTKQASHVQK